MCQPLFQRAPPFFIFQLCKQGGKASSDEPCPTKLSRWRGSTERRLGVYLLSCPQAVTLLFHGLIHGSFMIPSPKTGFPPQTCSRLATTLTVRVQTLFNHTVSADFSTLRFFAFLPIGKLSVTENQCQSVCLFSLFFVWAASTAKRSEYGKVY